MSDTFFVRVEGNLVVSIGRLTRLDEDPAPGTPLEVGTRLAANFRATGRLDDDYLFPDAESARTFATLCLQFMKNLIEQRTQSIAALPIGFSSFSVAQQPVMAQG